MTGKSKIDNDSQEFEKTRAVAAWDQVHSSALHMSKAAIDFGLLAIRAAVLTNAGALAAFLGIITQPFAKGIPIGWIALSFGFGLFLSNISAGASYLSQSIYFQAYNEYEFVWEYPYIKETEKFLKLKWWGDFFRFAAIILIIGSYSCLFLGGLFFYENFAFTPDFQ